MMKVIVDMAKKVDVKGFKIWVLELIHTTPEEFTEDDLMEMNTSQLMPDGEKGGIQETVSENKLTLDNLAEGRRRSDYSRPLWLPL